MKIVLATGNQGKLREMRELLAPLSVAVVAQSAFDTPEAVEDGLSFVENAIIKARNAATHCNLPAIGDDSGLEVEALDGAPGIYSARYAGTRGIAADNNRQLLIALKNMQGEQRRARFRCAMVFVRHSRDASPIIGEGSWEGRILEQVDGGNGFGYDPLFYVPERDCSAARLSAKEKNALSHRGKAIHALLEKLGSMRLKKRL